MSKIVSIIIPVYNVEEYLPQCLDSVLGQTYRDLEVIVVNDGSTDGSLRIMKEYAARDPRIRIIDKQNEGVAPTRNVGLKAATGDYILFVDSDDWIEPDMVEFLVTQQQSTQADIVVCGSVINDTTISKEPFEKQSWDKEKAVYEFLRHKELRGQLWNKLFRRNDVEGISFMPEISYGEDALFCWNVLQNIKQIVFTNKQLYHYRMNDGSISHGQFGKLKLTAHTVWKIINNDVETAWTAHKDTAMARWAIEDTLLIRSAAQCNYKKDINIKVLQTTIRKGLRAMISTKLASLKMIIYAFIASHSYILAKFIK